MVFGSEFSNIFPSVLYVYSFIAYTLKYRYALLLQNRKGKREYLNDGLTQQLVKGLNEYSKRKVEILRIRVGNKKRLKS
jgi:hypothetical protein